jgi:YD repeat-containing protein
LLGGSYRGQEVLELQYQGLKPIVQTYQELNCQQFDGKGNLISLIDSLNAITHGYTYDSLDRLLTAEGTGTNPLQNTGHRVKSSGPVAQMKIAGIIHTSYKHGKKK